MAAKKKVGELIKEARTNAGMTQEQLARKIRGVTASDISKAERGEVVPTQEVLKEIAKATGVTQKSLLDAARGTSTAKTSSAKKPATPANANSTMKVTATERRLVELYRAADTETKKQAMNVLKGDKNGVLFEALLEGAASLMSKKEMPELPEE